MKPPKTVSQQILFTLLTEKKISERDFTANGFRARLCELRKHITVKSEKSKFTNKFGHKGYFNYYFISPRDKKEARTHYEVLVR